MEPAERAFLESARTATLATIAPDGGPRLVPVCFIVGDDAHGRPVIYTPLDEKPKEATDPRRLARARDISRDPAVALLVDHWSEDWSKLGWLRLGGLATLLEPVDSPEEHAAGLAALLEKYPQYATHRLEERPLIRVEVVSGRSWGDLAVSE
jgi:PPOX class probable F420-dependent enzyme